MTCFLYTRSITRRKRRVRYARVLIARVGQRLRASTDHSQLYIINLYVFLRISGLFLVNGRKTTRFPLICRKARTLELPNRDAGKKQRTGAYVKGARRAQSSARRSGRLPHRRTYLRRYRQGHSKCSVSRPQAGHGVSLTKTQEAAPALLLVRPPRNTSGMFVLRRKR